MLPEFGEIDSRLAYRLRLVHRAVLLRSMADRNYRQAQAGYKKDHDRCVRFDPRFAEGAYVLVERPILMASAVDCMFFVGFSKLLTCHKRPYRVISFRSEFVKIDQDGIQNTISINRLARVARELRANMEVSSESRTIADISSAKEG